MPQSKERHKEYVRDQRALAKRIERDEGLMLKGSQGEGSQVKGSQEIVPASYVMGLHGKLKTLLERPGYITFSDGQVLDRLHQPEAMKELPGMTACNESSYNFKPRKER